NTRHHATNIESLFINNSIINIIQYFLSHYVYVIVDTAPVSLVTDTLLIANHSDLTLYVSRANYLDKRMLNIPKELYHDGKIKNMAFVVNDVDFARGYGYGYGYGYVYGEDHEKSLWEKIKKYFKNKK